MYNFIDSCLNHSAAPRDAGDYVEYWHTHDVSCSLQEYMGMDDKEYELWMKRGDDAIADILRRRRESGAMRRYVHGLSRKEA